MYYFIIPITKSYQILWKLHFIKCVLHLKMYDSQKYAKFAFGNTNRKGNVLNSNTVIYHLHIIYNILTSFSF